MVGALRHTHRSVMYMCNTTDRLPALRALLQKCTSPAASSHYRSLNRNITAGYLTPKVSFPPGEGHSSPTRSFQTIYSLSRGVPVPPTCRTQRLLPAAPSGRTPGAALGILGARPVPPGAGACPGGGEGPAGPAGERGSPGPPGCSSPCSGRTGQRRERRAGAAGSGSAALRGAVPGGSAGPSGGHGPLRAAPELGRAPGPGRARSSHRRRYRRGRDGAAAAAPGGRAGHALVCAGLFWLLPPASLNTPLLSG